MQGSRQQGKRMYFRHSNEILRDFPELVVGVLYVDGVDTNLSLDPRIAKFNGIAEERLAAGPESELPEIRAWRRAFSRMGLKPTQYRCASESLLRRFRKEGALPRIHPLIDLCNSISLAFAIPVAVLDAAQTTEWVEVRYASGTETYVTFAGEVENPEAHEVIFADNAGHAHARRWTNRQSAHSAVRDTTTAVLIVAEAMHDSASADVKRLVATIDDELQGAGSMAPKTALLSQTSSQFEF
jgi:DNA/RNA-binding domain of Phe-tRNA-synthetase-like protein